MRRAFSRWEKSGQIPPGVSPGLPARRLAGVPLEFGVLDGDVHVLHEEARGEGAERAAEGMGARARVDVEDLGAEGFEEIGELGVVAVRADVDVGDAEAADSGELPVELAPLGLGQTGREERDAALARAGESLDEGGDAVLLGAGEGRGV